MKEREQFKSRIGFILLSAGCAIGIGNVWRFPYVVGENGGGIFVLFYLFFLLLIGVPILSMEFSVGRASKKSAIKSFETLEKPKQKLCNVSSHKKLTLSHTRKWHKLISDEPN